MPGLRLLAEAVEKKPQIIISGSNPATAAEIKRLLALQPHLDCLNISGDYELLSEATSPSAIIHFAGFSPQTLSDTLDHTVFLHQMLRACASHRAKFILVLPNTRSHLYHTAVTLTTQFAKINHLNFQIIEILLDANPQAAAIEILKKVIHKFQPPPAPVPVTPTQRPPSFIENRSVSRPQLTRLFFSPRSLKAALIILILLSAPYLLAFSGLGLLAAGSKCALTKYLSAPICIDLGYAASALAYHFANFLPALSQISSRAGFPLSDSLAVFANLKSSHVNFTLIQNSAVAIAQNLQTGDPPTENISLLVSNLTQLSENLARLQSDLKSWHANTPRPPSQIATTILLVEESREVVNQLHSLADSYPSFFPSDRALNYAVLVMDNHELRPGGGSINSVVLLTFNRGKIEPPRVYSVNATTSNFVGEVEAPADFQTITGAKNWLLRDSNWDPDFSLAARQISWFLEKEFGQKIDVIVSVNLFTLAQLAYLVPDLSFNHQKITPENFQKLYFESLTRDSYTSTFLQTYAQAVAKQLSLAPPAQIKEFLGTALDGILARHVLIVPISFSSAGVSASGWDGSLKPTPCRSQLACVQQYLHIFDTNLSVNKTDPFVKKTSVVDVTLEPGLITTNTKITYTNTSQPGVWPGGNYKNYLRIFTAPDSQLQSVKLNGLTVPQSKFAVTNYGEFRQISLLFEVPAGGKTELELQTQLLSNTKAKFRYQFDIQPQPGQTSFPSQLTINYPETWFSTVYANKSKMSPSVASPGLLRYNPDLSRKVQLDIDFTPAPAI